MPAAGGTQPVFAGSEEHRETAFAIGGRHAGAESFNGQRAISRARATGARSGSSTRPRTREAGVIGISNRTTPSEKSLKGQLRSAGRTCRPASSRSESTRRVEGRRRDKCHRCRCRPRGSCPDSPRTAIRTWTPGTGDLGDLVEGRPSTAPLLGHGEKREGQQEEFHGVFTMPDGAASL